MRARIRPFASIAVAFAIFSALAAAQTPSAPAAPPASAADVAEPEAGRSRSQSYLAGIVAAAFLVFGALAGRGKGGPASRRLLRPSGRGPLQKR